jgi:putative hemolysin
VQKEQFVGNLIEIGVILLLTVLNGIFSMSETAIISARKARLQQRAVTGDLKAQAALALKEKPDRFLSTVQVGITLIGVLSGAFGGAGLSEKLTLALRGAGLSEKLSQNLGFGLVVVGITYLSLVIGELVPKTLALNNAEGISVRIAKPMSGLSVIASPVVWFLTLSTSAVLRVMGVKPSAESPVTEDEIKILIEQGTQAGVFAEQEQEIVERVFRLADCRAQHLMTPRREIVWLDVEDTWEETRQKVADAPHNEFPVCEGSLDKILGVVSLKSLWEQSAHGKEFDLRAVMRPPVYVLESLKALHLMEEFKRVGQNVVLIVDEYGVVGGLVTLHDVLEGIVGEVTDAEEPEERTAIQREDGSWLLDGTLSADELVRLLNLPPLPADEEGSYETLGGFVMARLGRIPVTTDYFEWNGSRFEVMDMDGHRVDKVLAVRQEETTPAEPKH